MIAAAAMRYLTVTTDPTAGSDTINEARGMLIRALAGTRPAHELLGDGYQEPGSHWRIGIDRRGADGGYHPIAELHTNSDHYPGSVIDEVVIQGWLHVEQLDHDVWWMGVGDWHLTVVVAPDGSAAAVGPPWYDGADAYREATLDPATHALETAAVKVAHLTHDRHRLAAALRGLVAAISGEGGAPSVADATRGAERALDDSVDVDRALVDAEPGGGPA